MDDRQLLVNQAESCLQNFLADANNFWRSGSKASLLSRKWAQTDAQGIERPFAAVATFLMAQPILLLQQTTESHLEIGSVLQHAREGTMRGEKIEQLIYKDFLTGLYNRPGLLRHAERALSVARSHQLPVTIAGIKLACLKSINDKCGYKTGDQFIIKVVSLFKNVFRIDDVLGRVDKDVFLALLPNMSSEQTIFFNARLNQAIHQWNTHREPGLEISCSIGFSSDDGMLRPLEQLISQAEAAMRKHKQSTDYPTMVLCAAV